MSLIELKPRRQFFIRFLPLSEIDEKYLFSSFSNNEGGVLSLLNLCNFLGDLKYEFFFLTFLQSLVNSLFNLLLLFFFSDSCNNNLSDFLFFFIITADDVFLSLLFFSLNDF